MDQQSNGDLEQPEEIKGPEGQRRDGRPTEDPIGEADPKAAGETPTVAPEEKGKAPSTEHAPGADL